jgi:hypothetical protein
MHSLLEILYNTLCLITEDGNNMIPAKLKHLIPVMNKLAEEIGEYLDE